MRLARACGYAHDPAFLAGLEFAARVHDLGKLAVHDSILRKPGLLTPEEWVEIRRHPESGARLLSLLPEFCLQDRSGDIRRMVGEHHENYDGSGYPAGLKGQTIHPGARLIRIADTYCAMTNNSRPYRPVLNDFAARQILRDRREFFDPHFLEVFLAMREDDDG